MPRDRIKRRQNEAEWFYLMCSLLHVVSFQSRYKKWLRVGEAENGYFISSDLNSFVWNETEEFERISMSTVSEETE